MTKEELVKLAIEAKSKGYQKYSNFKVGAALKTKDGQVILGSNIENAGYSCTICAERTAVFTAYIAGHREFESITIASDSDKYIPPCGTCRQVMMEICGPELEVIMVNKANDQKVMQLEELLPFSFNQEFLNK